MTRINLGIHPEELCDQHLIAEIHELPRVYGLVRKRLEKGTGFSDSPTEPTLDAGHVRYFFRRVDYLETRQAQLLDEAEWRGIKASRHRHRAGWPNGLMRGLDPGHFDLGRSLLIPRICQRLTAMVREPTWTNSEPPEWCLVALTARTP